MILLEESINSNSSLISLIATNKGDFDICALIYDLCTENYEEYLDKSIIERMKDVKEVSPRAYMDLKIIIKLIQEKYVTRDCENMNSLIIFKNDKCEYISNKFDVIFIYKFIRAFYAKEISKFNIGGRSGDKIR